MREVAAYLGLGSNVGDRERALRIAIERLGAVPGVRVLQVSALRESAFVGADGQPPVLNGAVAIATVLPPHALLALGKALEQQAGRVLPAARNSRRPLDVDLLLYGRERIDTRELVVPHPCILERPFVLEPLRELGIERGLVAELSVPAPRVVRTAAEFAAVCAGWREGGCLLGLVPTMGALHRGHQSLFEIARRECDRTAATIFVNPKQFAANEDLAAYPRDLATDLKVCAAAGVDVVFAPDVAEMYAEGFCSNVSVGMEAQAMEGAARPTHFSGVATVVARLFALANAHRAYFGRKDAQQVAVVRRLVRDLGFPVRIVDCPIVREQDGLALSSRNVYLSAADRQAATVLYRSLRRAQQVFRSGEREAAALLQAARREIEAEPRALLEYLELRAEGSLAPLPAGSVQGGRMLVVARFSGGERPVRLLDNLPLEDTPEFGAS